MGAQERTASRGSALSSVRDTADASSSDALVSGVLPLCRTEVADSRTFLHKRTYFTWTCQTLSTLLG